MAGYDLKEGIYEERGRCINFCLRTVRHGAGVFMVVCSGVCCAAPSERKVVRYYHECAAGEAGIVRAGLG